MFKNVRYLYKLIGTTDISSIGESSSGAKDSDITKAISALNSDLKKDYSLGTDVFISSGQSYTCPSDGYVIIVMPGGQYTNTVSLSIGSAIPLIIRPSTTASVNTSTMFLVKKGFVLKPTIAEGYNATVRFVPFI